MRNALAALVVLPFLATATMADTAERATFAPVGTKPAGETVNRARQKAVDFDTVSLSQAEVKDVDANGDGKISFEELLRHDLKSDF